MAPPQNILWKKSKSNKSEMFMDLFKIKRYEIPLTPIELQLQYFKITNLLSQKSNNEAKYARDKGKQFFSEGNYANAITKFNKSLRLAEYGTEEVGLAYANRSSCFFHMDMFEECIIDLKLAKKSHYPAKLLPKLETRMQQCTTLLKHKHIKSIRFNVREPALSFNEHRRFAGVADCLEIRQNDVSGRHVITTHDLQIGQTILVERPYSIIATTKHKHLGRDRCNYCLREFRNFITCTNCVATRFCYEGCMEESFHNLECNFPMPGKSQPEHYHLVHAILFKTNDAFPDVDMWMKTVNALLKGEEVAGLTNATQRDFCLLFQLTHNHDKRTNKQIQEMRRTAASIFTALMHLPDFSLKFAKMKQARFLQHLILHLLHIVEHAIDLYQYFQQDESTTMILCSTQQYASGMYAFACHINHSCVPNVCWYTVDDRLVCKVIRPIKKGKQIFRSYSGHSSWEQDAILISELENRYQFKCECFVCSNQIWSHLTGGINCTQDPLYQEAIEAILFTPHQFRQMPRERIEYFENKSIEFLEKYDTIHPINDTITIQKALIIVWVLLSSKFEFASTSLEK